MVFRRRLDITRSGKAQLQITFWKTLLELIYDKAKLRKLLVNLTSGQLKFSSKMNNKPNMFDVTCSKRIHNFLGSLTIFKT